LEFFLTDTPNRPVRVRFAPSPTGSLHIGGLRTALFNWLFARHHPHGKFILRIEDTDQKRYDPDALRILIESLRWAKLDWDEGPDVGGAYGPYIQSERLNLYQKWANWLIENDKAYKSYETAEELARMRKEMEARKLPPGYNRAHRYLTDEQRAAFEAEGRPAVVRLKMPLDGETVIHDAIHGRVSFENAKLQDTVLLKSDGFPTYHLAHVVDDHFMEISHVMRAVEWLPSLPIHWQLWLAFGWEAPIYAHLPVLLNPNGKGKISKRKPPTDAHGNIIPVLIHDYIDAGYLPDAVLNFLANIGWNFGEDREIFSLQEAIERFDLTRINSANSAFPPEKLEWLNGIYIREMPVEELAKLLRERLEKAGLEVNLDTLLKVAPLVQTRIKTLNDVVSLAGFFFHEDVPTPASNALSIKEVDTATTKAVLDEIYAALKAATDFSHASLEDAVRAICEAHSLKPKDVFGLLRVIVTGQTISTPLFESMEIIGKETVLARIQNATRVISDE
jgi:glutamyl-tRNA synthetase